MDMEQIPRKFMGDFKNAADVETIWKWTKEKTKPGDILIASLDLLLYGGIVPSRLHRISAEECDRRIERLRNLKEKNLGLKIFAFQLITRAPARNGSGEEPDYYEEYGYSIYRLGVLRDKEELGLLSEEEKAEKKRLEEEVPGGVLNDFIRRRQINYRNIKKSIDLASEGILDFLIIPLDDCKEYGYAPSERRKLTAYSAKKNMFSKIYFYPGADEVGCTLLARAINQERKEPFKIYVDYSSLRGQFQIPTYEDRSIGETAQYQLLAAGCEIVENIQEAEGVLAVNPPTKFSLRLEKELETEEIYLESERNLHAFTERIQRYLQKGLVCAVADCAIPNKADKALMQFLYEKGLLEKISAYGGWNTSSNTLGTVIAHMTALLGARQEKGRKISKEFLFFRYLEDWGYMAVVRKKVTEKLKNLSPEIGFLDLKDKEPQVREIVKENLKEFQEIYFPEAIWNWEISMPWNRMFEIEIKLSPSMLEDDD